MDSAKVFQDGFHQVSHTHANGPVGVAFQLDHLIGTVKEGTESSVRLLTLGRECSKRAVLLQQGGIIKAMRGMMPPRALCILGRDCTRKGPS